MLDALILAGDQKDYKPVGPGNKALIELMGKPLISYVIDALKEAKHIGRIFVVGPPKHFTWLKEQHPDITLLDQSPTLTENVLVSYKHICGDNDRHIFVTTSDIPFLQPREVDGFIEQSGFTAYDIIMGAAGEKSLERFYPAGNKPGIRQSCCYFKQGPLRLNNMFIMRYPTEALAEYSGILYNLRYQKRLLNFARLILEVVRRKPARLKLALTLLGMQTTLQAERLGLYGTARTLGRMLDLRKADEAASRATGARLRTVVMEYGAAAIDIDNMESLEAIRERFQEFMSVSRDIPGAENSPQEK